MPVKKIPKGIDIFKRTKYKVYVNVQNNKTYT